MPFNQQQMFTSPVVPNSPPKREMGDTAAQELRRLVLVYGPHTVVLEMLRATQGWGRESQKWQNVSVVLKHAAGKLQGWDPHPGQVNPKQER